MNDKEFMVEKIRSAYTEPQHTELDALKALDAKVKRPAKVFGFTWGTVGAIVMGSGMSLCMTELGAAFGGFAMVVGIAVGVAGLAAAALAWPLGRHILDRERRKIAPQILRLTDELM